MSILDAFIHREIASQQISKESSPRWWKRGELEGEEICLMVKQFPFLRIPLVGNALTKPRYSLRCSSNSWKQHGILRIWHNFFQFFLSILLRACCINFVSSLNAPHISSMTHVDQSFAFCLACAVNFRQERNLNVNALVVLVACFLRVNWWNMQRRMQMTSAVIADCYGNIYGRYKVRARKNERERKITITTVYGTLKLMHDYNKLLWSTHR